MSHAGSRASVSGGRLVALFFVVLLSLAMGLLAGTSSAAAAGLKVQMSPKKVRMNERTCFRGIVRDRTGKPVRGATVNLDGKIVKSKARGRFRLCTKLLWPGRHAAQVQKGKRTGFSYTRSKSFGVGLSGEWIQQNFQLPAYGGNGFECRSRKKPYQLIPDLEFENASCVGRANGSAGDFVGQAMSVDWTIRQDDGKVDVIPSFGSNPSTRRILFGYRPNTDNYFYFVTSGKLDDAGKADISSGGDKAKVGELGGPMKMEWDPHKNGDGKLDGYLLSFSGWVFKSD